MASISSKIELFIMSLLEDSDDIELKRNDLAQYFGCSPSQINYVLTTRFTLDRGYLITSKRGGGGCINVIRVQTQDEDIRELVTNHVGNEISQAKVHAIVMRLHDNRIVSSREASLILSAVSSLAMVPPSLENYIRANILKNMLCALMGEKE